MLMGLVGLFLLIVVSLIVYWIYTIYTSVTAQNDLNPIIIPAVIDTKKLQMITNTAIDPIVFFSFILDEYI